MTLDRRVGALGWLLRRTTGPVAAMSPARTRALRQKQAPRLVTDCLNGRRAAEVEVTDTTAPGPGGPVPIRVYRPAGRHRSPLPAVVVFHGGGWMFGDLDSADWLCSRIAARTPALVVSGTYRLAPEHPAPAAHDDAFAVASWAAAHRPELGASTRMAVVGESSGGTLAASVALAARDTGAFDVDLQALLYAITDLTLSSPSVVELDDEPILRSEDLRSFVRGYLGRGTRPDDPRFSPMHAKDHRGLPAALILGAAHDPLRDDSRRYADLLREHGVPVEHHELADAPHGFFSFPTICRAATPALDLLVTALRHALTEDGRHPGWCASTGGAWPHRRARR